MSTSRPYGDRRELERLTTRLEPEVSRRLRMLAVAERRPLWELLNELLREGLDRRERGE